MTNQRVIVVTGGASGIRLGICRHFAANGRLAEMLDVQEEVLHRESAVLREAGAKVIAYRAGR